MKTSVKAFLYSTLFSVCIFGSLSGYSQTQETPPGSGLTPKFGFKLGVNLANLYVDDVKDQYMKVGAVAGFYGKLPLAKGVSLQPELLYSNKGAKVTYNNAFQGSGEYRFNLHYIETPLTFVFNIVDNFNFHAGAYAAYLAAANVKNLKDGTIVGVTELNAEDFNRLDYGLVGGLGLDFDNVTLGVRYNYGLREVGHSGSLSGDITKNSKNSALSLFIGFAF